MRTILLRIERRDVKKVVSTEYTAIGQLQNLKEIVERKTISQSSEKNACFSPSVFQSNCIESICESDKKKEVKSLTRELDIALSVELATQFSNVVLMSKSQRIWELLKEMRYKCQKKPLWPGCIQCLPRIQKFNAGNWPEGLQWVSTKSSTKCTKSNSGNQFQASHSWTIPEKGTL